MASQLHEATLEMCNDINTKPDTTQIKKIRDDVKYEAKRRYLPVLRVRLRCRQLHALLCEERASELVAVHEVDGTAVDGKVRTDEQICSVQYSRVRVNECVCMCESE
jgi:hypothetical protein